MMLLFLAPVCANDWNGDFPKAEGELSGQQLILTEVGVFHGFSRCES